MSQQGKPSQEGKNKQGKKTQFPKPSFNFYWIYAIIVVVVLALNFVDINSTSREINWQRFENEMLKGGDVEKLVVVNKEICEVFIKQESLGKTQYQEVGKKAIGNGRNLGPHYYFNIGSIDSFEKKLSESQSQTPTEQRLNVIYETRKNWGVTCWDGFFLLW